MQIWEFMALTLKASEGRVKPTNCILKGFFSTIKRTYNVKPIVRHIKSYNDNQVKIVNIVIVHGKKCDLKHSL